jgi:hypothetical protein
MGPDHHAQMVAFQEHTEHVRSEESNVVLLVWISSEIMAKTIFFFVFLWVAPDQVNNFLLVFGLVTSKFDFKRSRDVIETFNILERRTDTSMATEDSLGLVTDNGSQGHLIKCFVDFGEHTVRVVDVFVKSLLALVTEAKILVDISIFVVASQKNDLLWILQLQREEKTDYF